MGKYIIYIPGSDSIMMDGKEPYVDSEKEVKRVIMEETVHKKAMYEPRPVSFLKAWAKRQQERETKQKSKPYMFSPTNIEIKYVKPENQKRFLLIVGEYGVKNSGTLVKDFDTLDEAAKLANKSIKGLIKELPHLGYYVYDNELETYVLEISGANGTAIS